MSRVFVTERELEVLSGDADVEDPENYQEVVVSRLRSRFKQGAEELEQIEEATEAGELDVDLRGEALDELCE